MAGRVIRRPIADNLFEDLIIEQIDGKEVKPEGTSYLVRWRGRADPTWESAQVLESLCPDVVAHFESRGDARRGPEKLMARRVGPKGGLEFQVKWEGLPAESNTWEAADLISAM